MGPLAAALALLILASCSPPPPPATTVDIAPHRISAHVKFLSDDLLEGRGVATRGEALATTYIASPFAQYGLEPAGDNGAYFQKVPLVGVRTLPASTFALNNRPLKWQDEYVGVNQRQQKETAAEAEAIFVGHGITAPEYQWDDYKGVDVKGKWAVLFTNEPNSEDPKFFGGRSLTYYGRWTFKYEEAARRGALGCLIVHTDKTAGYGWSVVRASWSGQDPRVKLNAGDHALAFAGWVTEAIGEQIFATIKTTVAQALADADKRDFRPVPLPIRIRGRFVSEVSEINTRNVIARLPGSDPQLRDQAVLYTAHWDHLGIGSPVKGDPIYNGAVDNASGCGILLELARAYSLARPRPKRTILFASVTAEEGGLRGSEYLGLHSPIPAAKLAASLNFDGEFAFGRTADLTMVGYERTTLKDLVEQTARQFNVKIRPDPNPEQGHYYRSDHFSLAHVGVPSFSIGLGRDYIGKPAGWGEKAFEEYNSQRYHQPSDEFDPSWDFSGIAELARFGYELGREIADLPQLPSWQPGDEFLAARLKSWGKTTP